MQERKKQGPKGRKQRNAQFEARPRTPRHGEGDSASPGSPAPEVDPEHHAATQRVAHHADLLRSCVFPAMMANALGIDMKFDVADCRAYLDRLIEDEGNPTSPVERMMLEQLALAHFRIARLQVDAQAARTAEGVKILNAAAARMLGEMRRTALALRAYRMRVPGDGDAASQRRFKIAQ